ncbi:hypothetical protein [Verrucosispora sp. NA02020]|uniref:hypothetical protein n=1 Tax=Verrucosispora sp. NA02020 TaxID=2742132 RepID=UPI00159087FA|nr:hypothetical protein [Verrucosispora sp. NA02020]QKW15372.1 hypothetical protein HUT12_23140 [Verrucosispora sp. NA02020]
MPAASPYSAPGPSAGRTSRSCAPTPRGGIRTRPARCLTSNASPTNGANDGRRPMPKHPAPVRVTASLAGYSEAAFAAAAATRRMVAESAPAVQDVPEVETSAPTEPTTPLEPAPEASEAEPTGDLSEAGNAARLRKYWTTGPGAIRLAWGTPGDWTRCVKALDGKMRDPKGYCAELHKQVVGYWPGDKRNNSAGEADASDHAERITVREADLSGATVTQSGRLSIRLIRAGWSLNGNLYPAEVLRRDGPKAWPAGTLCYVDHATDEEDAARPSGSVRNLAAVTTSDARWDEAEQALTAEARLFAPWREAITDMADTIGMSIRAWVTGEHGERDGRTGFIVQSIPEGRSVDFVTKPAAGGGIVSVLESVGNQVPTAEARNVGQWLESRLHLTLTQLGDDMYGDGRLTRDERITLSAAIGDALQAWTARVEQDAPALFQRDLWDEPAVPETAQAQETAPAASPADPPPPAEKPPADDTAASADTPDDVTDGAPPTAPNPPTKEEPAMSGTTTGTAPVEAGTAPVVDTATTAIAAEAPSVDVQALVTAALTEALGPVTQQLATVQQALTAQQNENTALRNRATASEAVAAALRAPEHADVAAQIGPRVTARILDAVPTTAEGVVDGAALTERITATITDEATYVRGARAEALEAAGVGQPYGLGQRADESHTQDDGFTAELDDFFSNTLGLASEAAKVAAKGRA